jgi:hypothetical protein
MTTNNVGGTYFPAQGAGGKQPARPEDDVVGTFIAAAVKAAEAKPSLLQLQAAAAEAAKTAPNALQTLDAQRGRA